MLKVGPVLSSKSTLLLLEDISMINELSKQKYMYSYISTSTHEYKTPLNPILNAFEMIEKTATYDQVPYIKTGKRGVKMLLEIIDNNIVSL